MTKALEKLKISYLKKAVPWSDDLSHYKDPDRINHFNPPLVLKPKQIKFLISSPTFMNDYSFFYENNGLDAHSAKTIMKALLTENLAFVNTKKPIDLDYYFALDYKCRVDDENAQEDEDEDLEDESNSNEQTDLI